MAKPHRKLPTLTPQEIEKFWSLVDKTPGQGPKGECHEWKGNRGGRGVYGYHYYSRRQFRAHRIAFFLLRGVDPGDSEVCHTCDNPPCCRDEHLFAGTHADNFADAKQKGRLGWGSSPGDQNASRRKPECLVRGEAVHTAKLSPEQVRTIRTRYAQGGISQRRLAKEYGVLQAAIGDIVRRKTWAHIS